MGNKVAKRRDQHWKCGGKMEGSTLEMWWKNGGICMGNKVAKWKDLHGK